MNLKYKIVFFNFMIFLIIFDLIYLFVWILSIKMDPVKAIIVAGIAAFITPWARPANPKSGKKVIIRSYAYRLYRKYLKKQKQKSN